ncbi:unnamed protein product [Auanema sp. JU1783]|nr:unnamed protein product [Auanema sp. JU1783]
MQFLRNRSNFPRDTPPDSSILNSDANQDTRGTWPKQGGNYPSTSTGVPQLSPPVSTEDPLATFLLGIADFGTKLFVTHPCTVLRRQCQVHQHARSLHLTPVTLVPVICNIVSKEGLLTLWKGSLGSAVVWGLSSVTEILIADLFGLPRQYVRNGSSEKYWRFIMLKAATFFTMTPFLISSFTETVRSESGLGGDDNRVFDVLVKGLDRLRFAAVFNARDASKRFSVLHLAIPTVTFKTSHFIIESALHHQFYIMAKRYIARKPEAEKSKFHQYLPILFARLSSSVLTDLILFPAETILHRMYIQGTRTLIDNLDTGLSAVSIPVKYNGFFDCLRSTVESEGFWALYSGIGALGMQYILHSLLQQLIRALFDQGSEVLRKATADHQFVSTPPLSTNTSFTGPLSSGLGSSAPLSGPFAQQLSPITSPRKSHVLSPPRDPTQFPTFGESLATLDAAYPPYTNRQNVFGSPTRSTDLSSPLPPMHNDRLSDPFSG